MAKGTEPSAFSSKGISETASVFLKSSSSFSSGRASADPTF